ncbi:MAG: hypothetical protein M3N91_07185 [Pseudomonadota bacterium]|nr:hypothetical protein [Pseudomonadota bacterium]
MELLEALRLVKRHAELERAKRRPGGIRILEERELQQLSGALASHGATVTAIKEAAARKRRPLDMLSIDDIELRTIPSHTSDMANGTSSSRP